MSNFTGDVNKRKYITSYMFMLAREAVRWVSKLQTIIALSTRETEKQST